MNYQHLLVAVDGADDCTALIHKALALAKGFGAQLSVVSVIQPPPIAAMATDASMGVPIMASAGMESDWTAKLSKEKHSSLIRLCKPLGIAEADLHVVTDHADSGILNVAEQLQADLIVIGHHHRKGFFSMLFSHTDQNVVSKAVCDVLAVVLDPLPASVEVESSLAKPMQPPPAQRAA